MHVTSNGFSGSWFTCMYFSVRNNRFLANLDGNLFLICFPRPYLSLNFGSLGYSSIYTFVVIGCETFFRNSFHYISLSSTRTTLIKTINSRKPNSLTKKKEDGTFYHTTDGASSDRKRVRECEEGGLTGML